MKKKKIKLLKSGILLLGISLFLWNCQKEDTISLSYEKENNTLPQQNEWLEINELPNNILKILSSSTIQRKGTSNKTSLFYNTITNESALRIIDSLGNQKYSFKLNTINNNSGNYFFDNFIISIDTQDNVATYIIRYKPDNNWIIDNSESSDFTNFTGNISYYTEQGFYFGKQTL